MKPEEIIFKNETLWLGNLGHMLVSITFVCSLLAFILYALGVNSTNSNYKAWGRKMFWAQALGVAGIFIVLFVIIFLHKYEYAYAQKHSSNSLPLKYMISCFWEGQEGSFLLWMFWNALLGILILRKKDEWEAPVVSIVSLIQFMLGSMLLGLEFGSQKMGSSPFKLLREANPDIFNIPVFANLDKGEYLKVYKNGTGLNPILQNPWMVIHPPTLFFGFASAAIPFAYSIAGLWTGKLRAWVTPALTWGLVCVGVLGTGIIMGGWWAYESLSFGGYWAWDPVENASLLPWLIMAASVHLLIISKNTGRHLFTSHFLSQLSFLLVLYATFLTRSGVLGDASVHSFTDLGLSGQLLLFIFLFIAVCIVFSLPDKKKRNLSALILVGLLLLMIVWGILSGKDLSLLKNTGIFLFAGSVVLWIWQLYRTTFVKNEDEKWLSRELWMFIGALFLILSLVQIFAGTSSPVFSKIFNTSITVNKAEHYNMWQLFLSMPILFIMSYGQWLRWRETDISAIRKKLLFIAGISLLISILLGLAWSISNIAYLAFLFLSVMVVVGNFSYIDLKKYKRFVNHGASIAHAGFGILLIGVLVSSVNKTIVTETKEGIQMAPETDEKGEIIKENVENNHTNMLLPQNKAIINGSYGFEYKGYHIGGVDSISKFYRILFTEYSKDKRVKDTYSLYPEIQNNPKFGRAANPDTKHYLHKDVFTHVSFDNTQSNQEPFSNFIKDSVLLFEKFLSGSGKVKMFVDSVFNRRSENGIEIFFRIKGLRGDFSDEMLCGLKSTNNDISSFSASSDELGVTIEPVNFILPQEAEKNAKDKGKIVFRIGEREPNHPFIVVKAIEFPWINLVWGGTMIMVIGFYLSVRNRILQQRNLSKL